MFFHAQTRVKLLKLPKCQAYYGQVHWLERGNFTRISQSTGTRFVTFMNNRLTLWGGEKMNAISQMTFQMHFREWHDSYFEVCTQGSNWQYPSIGLDNGFAPNRRQVIIWTNADTIHWHIYAALGVDELIKHRITRWNRHFVTRMMYI